MTCSTATPTASPSGSGTRADFEVLCASCGLWHPFAPCYSAPTRVDVDYGSETVFVFQFDGLGYKGGRFTFNDVAVRRVSGDSAPRVACDGEVLSRLVATIDDASRAKLEAALINIRQSQPPPSPVVTAIGRQRKRDHRPSAWSLAGRV